MKALALIVFLSFQYECAAWNSSFKYSTKKGSQWNECIRWSSAGDIDDKPSLEQFSTESSNPVLINGTSKISAADMEERISVSKARFEEMKKYSNRYLLLEHKFEGMRDTMKEQKELIGKLKRMVDRYQVYVAECSKLREEIAERDSTVERLQVQIETSSNGNGNRELEKFRARTILLENEVMNLRERLEDSEATFRKQIEDLLHENEEIRRQMSEREMELENEIEFLKRNNKRLETQIDLLYNEIDLNDRIKRQDQPGRNVEDKSVKENQIRSGHLVSEGIAGDASFESRSARQSESEDRRTMERRANWEKALRCVEMWGV